MIGDKDRIMIIMINMKSIVIISENHVNLEFRREIKIKISFFFFILL